MSKIRLILIGGFLGAGKTTAISRLARDYVSQGLNVAIVTNDQAKELVDTSTLRKQGFNVDEVSGACFCCKFDSLIDALGRIDKSLEPDVILAEPVGSCTDVVATVIEPLRELYGDRFEITRYIVLCKPEQGMQILLGDENAAFSTDAQYIFLKQLEEADVIAINKCDKLTTTERMTLLAELQMQHPEKMVIAVSARTGEGWEAVEKVLSQKPKQRKKMIDVNYDTYAAGEAELGWLNASTTLTARDGTTIDQDHVALDIVKKFADHLSTQDAETAHLKVLVQGIEAVAIANKASTCSEPELTWKSNAQASHVEIIVNARVAIEPKLLTKFVHQTLNEIADELEVTITPIKGESFRPARPVPTHRFSSSV
jgi:G3E family GTPase